MFTKIFMKTIAQNRKKGYNQFVKVAQTFSQR